MIKEQKHRKNSEVGWLLIIELVCAITQSKVSFLSCKERETMHNYVFMQLLISNYHQTHIVLSVFYVFDFTLHFMFFVAVYSYPIIHLFGYGTGKYQTHPTFCSIISILQALYMFSGVITARGKGPTLQKLDWHKTKTYKHI
jgi:hypothetical protein